MIWYVFKRVGELQISYLFSPFAATSYQHRAAKRKAMFDSCPAAWC